MHTEVYKPLNATFSIPTEKSVLVVEDDEAISESLCAVLRDEGFSVLQAGNGLEAIHLLRSRQLRLNLILLDMVMPKMDGAEFLDLLQNEPAYANVPVALLSAAKVEEMSPRAVVRLAKPVEIEDLLNVVHRYADQPGVAPSERAYC